MKRYLLIFFVSILTMLSVQAIGQDSTRHRCEGITVKGERCRNMAGKDGKYCHYHDGSKTICGARTSKGTPCKIPVRKEGEHCWRHS